MWIDLISFSSCLTAAIAEAKQVYKKPFQFKLCCEDLTFTANFLETKMRSSKTDQYQQGDTVLGAHTGRPTCPISMVEHYTAIGELVGKSGLLFRPLTSNWKN